MEGSKLAMSSGQSRGFGEHFSQQRGSPWVCAGLVAQVRELVYWSEFLCFVFFFFSLSALLGGWWGWTLRLGCDGCGVGDCDGEGEVGGWECCCEGA